jgi:hypothetical protein
MTPCWTEYTKTPPHAGGSFYFLIEKLPITAFIGKQSFTRYNASIFCQE